MDLSTQLRSYLSSHPDSITSSLTIRGVLKDFNCPERIRENMAHLIDCGLGTVLMNHPEQLSAEFVRDVVREMDLRFGTAEEYALEGIRIWAEVYHIQAVCPAAPPEFRASQADAPESETSQADIPEPEEHRQTKPLHHRKHTAFVSLKDMHWKVRLLFLGGILLVVYHLFTFTYFLEFRLEFMSVDALILLCLGQLHILKTGLPVCYAKDKKGKYKGDWKETLLSLLAIAYMFITLNQMVHLEDNSAVPLGAGQFYIGASFLMVPAYFCVMSLLTVPKKEKQTV